MREYFIIEYSEMTLTLNYPGSVSVITGYLIRRIMGEVRNEEFNGSHTYFQDVNYILENGKASESDEDFFSDIKEAMVKAEKTMEKSRNNFMSLFAKMEAIKTKLVLMGVRDEPSN